MRVFQNFRGRRRVFLRFFEGFLLALEKILKIDRVQPLVFLKDQDFEPPNFLAIKFLIRLRRRIMKICVFRVQKIKMLQHVQF